MLPAHIAAHREYLKSATWQDIRSDILKRDNHTCQWCKNPGSDVHHLTYKNWGNEKPEDLITLCRACHDRHHSNKKTTKGKKHTNIRKIYGYLNDEQKMEICEKFSISPFSLRYHLVSMGDYLPCIYAAQLLGYEGYYFNNVLVKKGMDNAQIKSLIAKCDSIHKNEKKKVLESLKRFDKNRC